MLSYEGRECCGNCVWWRRQEPAIATAQRDPSMSPELGACIFAPPVVVPSSHWGLVETIFPVTHESRVCCEWTAQFDGDDGSRAEPDAPIDFAAVRAKYLKPAA